MGAFACNGCGGCCRRVKMIHPDWPTKPDGSCVHLTPFSRCAIYEQRPLVCRVDEMRPAGISVERWHQLNAEVCAQFQAEDAK